MQNEAHQQHCAVVLARLFHCVKCSDFQISEIKNESKIMVHEMSRFECVGRRLLTIGLKLGASSVKRSLHAAHNWMSGAAQT